ncbi:MAG: hypothetical protein IJF76_05220 [Clostridia bacterium]|nr:hypothetical protein [Clostridia bacterium]
MKKNPFLEKATSIDESYASWCELASTPYDKKSVDPYTKTRIILMNGTEFEANWFMHQFSRHCKSNDLRRELARVRRREQQQQKTIAALKPLDENMLETTISYEQLAVDLTAALAKHVKDPCVKKALDFALLEDFDHLYRYSNLLMQEHGIDGATLVGKLTEITPGRPTISEHRYPADDIRCWICSNTADLFTRLTVNVITAAEQQTMNYYMNIANLYPTEAGRKLYTEIAMIEEQHVSHYGSLVDVNCSWLESWLMHEYCECYLYWSCAQTEVDERIKKLWEKFYLEECGHLQHVAGLLQKYEGKPWQSVFPFGAEFPEPLLLGSNIDYVQEVLRNTVHETSCMEGYCNVSDLDKDSRFKWYNDRVNCDGDEKCVASHCVIRDYIKEHGEDYRFEVSQNPVPELRDRTRDNVKLGRV